MERRDSDVEAMGGVADPAALEFRKPRVAREYGSALLDSENWEEFRPNNTNSQQPQGDEEKIAITEPGALLDVKEEVEGKESVGGGSQFVSRDSAYHDSYPKDSLTKEPVHKVSIQKDSIASENDGKDVPKDSIVPDGQLSSLPSAIVDDEIAAAIAKASEEKELEEGNPEQAPAESKIFEETLHETTLQDQLEKKVQEPQILQFDTHFQHIFPRIKEQVLSGLQVVHRTFSYLRKIVTGLERNAAELSKTTLLQRPKFAKLNEQDRSVEFISCVSLLPDCVEEILHRQKAYCIRINESVITPLEEFFANSDKLRAKIEDDETRFSSQVNSAIAEMMKQRKTCLKLYEEMVSLYRATKAKGLSQDALKKVQAKLEKFKSASHITKEFTKFEAQKLSALGRQKDYVQQHLPSFLRQMQSIETSRLDLLRSTMHQYASCQFELMGVIPPTPHASPTEVAAAVTGKVRAPCLVNLTQDAAGLDTKLGMASLIHNLYTMYGTAPEYNLPVANLPCSIQDLESGAWKDALQDEENEDDEDDEDGDDGEEDKAKPTSITNIIRGKVSKKKKRFQEDGFDLDLSYITPRIIAMGIPSSSLAGMYRNKMSEVRRFFSTRHAHQYMIFNLCSEAAYDENKFEGRVCRMGFDDHNPPPFNLIPPFCAEMDKWMAHSNESLAAVHCKAGKGRTGTMIAAYLVHSGQSPTAEAALHFFAVKRTRNAKGVTIPSQQRYTWYYERFLRGGMIPTKSGWCQTERTSPLRLVPSAQPVPIPPTRRLVLKRLVLHSRPYDVNSEGMYFIVSTFTPDVAKAYLHYAEKDNKENKEKDKEAKEKSVLFSSKGVIRPVVSPGYNCIVFAKDVLGASAPDREPNAGPPGLPHANSTMSLHHSMTVSMNNSSASLDNSTFDASDVGLTNKSQGRVLLTSMESALVAVEDDICIRFFAPDGKKLFHFWLNLRFLVPFPPAPPLRALNGEGEPIPAEVTYGLRLEKKAIDKAVKDKRDDLYPENMAVEVIFSEIPEKSA